MQSLTIDKCREIGIAYGKTVKMSFPSHGFTVELSALSAADVLAVFEITRDHEPTNVEVNHAANVEACSRSIVENGQRIFDNEQGREALRALPTGILQRMASEALKLSGLDGQVEKKS